MGSSVNRCELSATIVERDAMRFTPAGVPALNLRLEHTSDVLEAGQVRQVRAAIKAVAFGPMAERLAAQPVGGQWRFSGFLASTRNARQVQLHIQELTAQP